MVSIALSISPASRTAPDNTCTPKFAAPASTVRNSIRLASLPLFTRTSTRFTPGASSLSNSNHFPLNAGSRLMNPVALPPGRAKLATTPVSTGSVRAAKTMGIDRVWRCNSCMKGVFATCTTSGFEVTISATVARIRSIPPPVIARYSSRRLRPSVQPRSRKPRARAARRDCPSGSFSARFINTLTRRSRSPG